MNYLQFVWTNFLEVNIAALAESHISILHFCVYF